MDEYQLAVHAANMVNSDSYCGKIVQYVTMYASECVACSESLDVSCAHERMILVRKAARSLIVMVMVYLAIVAVAPPALAGGILIDKPALLGVSQTDLKLLNPDRRVFNDWNLSASFRLVDASNAPLATGPSTAWAEVVITWSAPSPLVSGQLPVKYNVYRSSANDDLFQAKNRLNDFALTGLTVTDSVAVGRYYYAVQAVLTDGTVVSSSAPMEANLVATPPTQPTTQPGTDEGIVPSSGGPGKFPIYLIIDGIPGSIAEGGFAGGSHVLDYQWGVTHADAGSGPSLQQLTVVREPDNASGGIATAYYTGQQIPTVTMTVCGRVVGPSGGDLPHYRLTLYNARVADLQVELGDQSVCQVLEKISFVYDDIKVQGRYATDGVQPGQMIAVDYRDNHVVAPEAADKTPMSSRGDAYARAPRGVYLTVPGMPANTSIPMNAIKYGIEISDFHFGGSWSATGPVLGRMTVAKRVDAASIRLVAACFTGELIPDACLEVARGAGPGGGYVVYRAALTGVRIESVQAAKSDDENAADQEILVLSYTGMTIESRSIGMTGPGPWVTAQLQSR